jgi:signal transduction histidine kinase
MRSSFANVLLFIGLCGICGSTYEVVNANAQIHAQSVTNVAAVNLTARQATLFQTLAKDVNAIAFKVRAGKPAGGAQVELKSSADLFEQTLGALTNANKAVPANAATGKAQTGGDKPTLDLLDQIGTAWAPLRKNIDALSGAPSQNAIDATLAQLEAVERPLLGELDGLTDRVQVVAARSDADRTSQRDLWTLGILVGILFVGMSFFMRVAGARATAEHTAKALADGNAELQARTDELAQAKRGTDALMETVGQGLALIDGDYTIAPQYSQQLEKIFDRKDLAGQNFLKLFERLLPARDYDATRRFLALMFNADKKERVVLQVNPLDEIDLAFPLDEGGFKTKTISASFRRIMNGDKVAQAFVAISDITERAAASRELRQSEDRKERQFELLLGTMHVDPAALDDFGDLVAEQLGRITDALRAEDFASGSEARSQVLRGRLDTIYRAVHTIKGNASSLRIEPFVRTAMSFEAKLSELRSRAALGGDDFLAVVIQQSELRILLDQLREIRKKYVGQGALGNAFAAASALKAATAAAAAAAAAPAPAPGAAGAGAPANAAAAGTSDATPAAPAVPVKPAAQTAGGLIGSELAAFAERIALERGSKVAVKAQLEALDTLDPAHRRTIKNVLIQLVRNSLAHGIEEPDDRVAAGKAPAGTISITASRDDSGALRLRYSDDGRGLDPDVLRAKALASGIISDPAQVDDASAVGLIFHPGFSTADGADEVAGRGVGMDIIKQHVVDEAHGEIGIRSDPGRYLEFELTFPAFESVAA